MQDDTSAVRDAVDLVELIREYTPLNQVGRNFKGICPFHEEKTPSFFVRPDNRLWYCFGCQKGGDAFSFLMEQENILFPEALEILAKRAGVKLSGRQDVHYNKKKNALYQLMLDVTDFYIQALKEPIGEQARLYVVKRKMSNAVVDKFGIGYAPDSWDTTRNFLKTKGYTDEQMAEAGLIIFSEKSNKYYDRFRNRLMFPIHDHLGRVVGFSGRTLAVNDEKEAKYINSPETILYTKGDVLFGYYFANKEIMAKGFSLIVEGNVDVVSLVDAGIPYVVAPLGTGLTERQLQLLGRVTKKVLIVFDADDAGKKAAYRAVLECMRLGVDVKVATLTAGKDPDDAVKNDKQVFIHDLRSATSGFDYILNVEESSSQGTQAFSKSAIATRMFPLIALTDEQIIRESYFEKLARAVGSTLHSVKDDFNRWTRQQGKPPAHTVRRTEQKAIIPVPRSKKIVMEEYVVSLLFNMTDQIMQHALVGEELSMLEPGAFDDPFLRDMVELFVATVCTSQQGIAEVHEQLGNFEDADVKRLHLIILKDFGTVMSSPETFIAELRQVHRGLLKVFYQQELQRLLQQKQGAGGDIQSDEVHDKIREITTQLRDLQR